MHPYLKGILSIGQTAALLLSMGTAQAATVFINEIHYDNSGTDVDEGVELAGPAGINLTDWQLAFYNGSNGEVYATEHLAGLIPDLSGGGMGVVAFAIAGLQNGPDAIALVDSAAAVVQFISYEGTFTAAGGPADGLLSVDIGVAEDGTTAAGNSLQLVGSGSLPGDFTWAAPAASSFGVINPGQTLVAPVPLPPSLVLLCTLLPVLAVVRRRVPGRGSRFAEPLI